jgi:type I restriction enzyme R subunit
MIGRGVRIIDDTDFQSVTDDADRKDRFFVVDAVGVTETDLIETILPLERKPTVSLDKLMNNVAFGNTEAELASTVAGRLARLDQRLPKEDREALAKVAGGAYLGDIAHGIVEALDPDNQLALLRKEGRSEEDESAVAQAATKLIGEALRPLSANPELRNAILDARKSFEQTIDEISKDTLLEAGPSGQARERAAAIVKSFKQYIEENKDEIRALQVLYSRPYGERLTFSEIKDLANAIKRPPHQWTPERLWHAYEMLDGSKVRGSGGKMLTDIVALVRFALEQENELVPFHDQVEQRFQAWLLSQKQKGVGFSDEQLQWLTWMKDNVASDMRISPDSFEYTPFAEHGGIGKAIQVFGEQLTPLTDELTQALAA